MKQLTIILFFLFSFCSLLCAEEAVPSEIVTEDSVSLPGDTLVNVDLVGADTLAAAEGLTEEDTITIGDLIDGKLSAVDVKEVAKSLTSWKPSPKRAMWLGIVLPGAGQIYNHKYWKLPIFYGGMVGCVYAWRWNNIMYTDYSRAYLDLMDDDPNTDSYNSFMHLGAQINDSNKARYENIFKRRKDYYRRYRDLSIFCLIGVYALSVIDAYVDASLSQFDISKDLSLRVEPAVINSRNSRNPLESSSLGVQCQLNF